MPKAYQSLFHFLGNVLRSWDFITVHKTFMCIFKVHKLFVSTFCSFAYLPIVLPKCSEYTLQPAIWVRRISSHRQEIIDLTDPLITILHFLLLLLSASANS